MTSTARNKNAPRGGDDLSSVRGYGVSAIPDWRNIEWTKHTHQFKSNGRRVSYVDIGEGENACIFVHGLANSWHFWLETLPTVSQHRRAIALDLPGFGSSQVHLGRLTIQVAATAIERLRQELSLEEVTLVGHSMGGIVAVEAAAQYPDTTRGVVLAGGTLVSVIDFFHDPLRTLRRRPKAVSSFLLEVASASLPLFPAARRLLVGNDMLRRVALGTYAQHPERLQADLLLQALSGVGKPGVLPAVLNGFGYNLYATLDKVRCPVLLIAGADDRLIPVDDVETFASRCLDAQTVIIDDAGHWPMFERPTEFNHHLLEFLDSTERA